MEPRTYEKIYNLLCKRSIELDKIIDEKMSNGNRDECINWISRRTEVQFIFREILKLEQNTKKGVDVCPKRKDASQNIPKKDLKKDIP